MGERREEVEQTTFESTTVNGDPSAAMVA